MADINFNKKSVQGLIETAAKSKFVIPEYQDHIPGGKMKLDKCLMILQHLLKKI